jgi:hypothetical protein
VPERAVDRTSDNPFTPRNTVVGDFFAPFFTIKFISYEPQQGESVNPNTGAETTEDITEMGSISAALGETTLKFTTDGRTSQFRSYATSLTVTDQGGGACMVEIRLEPPLDDALKLIEQRLLQFNTIAVVEWGWLTNGGQDTLLSDKHYFVLQMPQLDISGTDVSITLTGVDLLGYSALKRASSFVYKRTEASEDGVTYNTDFKILKAVADKSTMRLNSTLAPEFAETTETRAVPVEGSSTQFVRQRVKVKTPVNLPIHAERPANPREAPTVEQNELDWVFFRRICDSNRCDFLTIGDTIFLVDQNIARVQQFAYRFVFWNQLLRSDDIPVYSFTTSALPTLFMPPESKEVRCYSADEDARKTNMDAIDPMTAANMEMMGLRGAGGKTEADGRTLRITDDVQVIPNPRFAPNETGRRMSCPGGAAGHEEHTRRIVSDANSLCNLNMEVSIPGVPGLVPMQVVRVDGVSKIFSGPYLVLKVVHKLTTSGYDCDVTLISERATGDPEVGRGTRPPSPNDPDRGPNQQGSTPVDGDTH